MNRIPFYTLALCVFLLNACSHDDHGATDMAVDHSQHQHVGGMSPDPNNVSLTGAESDIAYYTCPMHGSVKMSEAGTCPICGMDLVAVLEKDLNSGNIYLDGSVVQRIGVTTAHPKKTEFVKNIRAVGKVSYDERRISELSLKYEGWIEDLWVDYVGGEVKVGEPLFSIYSPDLNSAQAEFVQSMQRRNNSATQVAEARLRLWGLNDAQISELQKTQKVDNYVTVFAPQGGTVIHKHIVEGSFIPVGQTVYRIADLSRLWIEAEVYEADLPTISVGQPVTIRFPNLPGRELHSEISYIYPYLSDMARTGRIRIEVDNSDGLLKPEMFADVLINAQLGERLVVPTEAVIYSGKKRIVFVDNGDGSLTPRVIVTGFKNDSEIEVIEGLSESDAVVTSSNFLLAAESRLRSAGGVWE